MGSRRLQPPAGYTIAQLDTGEHIILVTPRDQAGQLLNFGVVFDPELRRTGVKLPKTFGKRAQAITYATQTELAELRREVARMRRSSNHGATNTTTQPSIYTTSPAAASAVETYDADDEPLEATV